MSKLRMDFLVDMVGILGVLALGVLVGLALS